MKPDRHQGLGINDVGTDEFGRHVLVINCRCVLPHSSTAEYQATHEEGCLMRPSEGLVFEMDGDKVTGWGCHNIFDLTLTQASREKADDIVRQMGERLEKDRKARKADNFRRKPRPVW